MNKFIRECEIWAKACHQITRHRYNGLPYSVHLSMVYATGMRFIHLIPEEDRENVLAACWTHDTIEDTRQTYNDVLKATSKEVADITYALTNEKGRTRAERANDRYYSGIRATPYATFVKLCDRAANVQYSKEQGSSMFERYKEEHLHFLEALGLDGFTRYAELCHHITTMFL